MDIFISLIFLSVTALFSATRQIQMLQQNSYFVSRYFGWLLSAFSFRAALCTALLFVSVILIILKLFSPLLILSLVSAAFMIPNAVKKQKTSIKKLVFTARIKRLYATLFIIITVLFLTSFLWIGSAIILLVFCFIPPISVLIARTVNSPLENLISWWYVNDAKKIIKKSSHLRVIGVTGSYGKTSTKYILSRILSEKFNVVMTPESFNTPMGIVRTVRQSLKPDTEIFIAEMGAKRTGDIKEICKIANPTLGVITSVGPQHLDTFKSVENVASTKFELADWVKKNDGKMFLNSDNEIIRNLAPHYDSVFYGTESGDYRAENISYGRLGLEFDVVSENDTIHIKTRLLGLHNVQNITAAVAVAKSLGVKSEDICFAASRLKPVSHRLEMKNFINGSLLLDDAYNSNPSGCMEALNVLSTFHGMKKIIVTPGLVELGEKEYDFNVSLGKKAGEVCDTVILVGQKRSVPLKNGVEKTNLSKENLFVVSSFKEAMMLLNKKTDKDTVVLFENDLPDNYSK